MRLRPVRVGLYWMLGFVVGSMVLGTYKGNPFVDNLVYGIWTGAIAGIVVGGAVAVFDSRRK